MIRIQYLPPGTTTGIARFYENDAADPMADYQLVCNLNWESRDTVWVHGLMGQGSRKLWRDFVQAMDAAGVQSIRATRAPGHLLPRARAHADGRGLVLDIGDLMERQSSRWGGLQEPACRPQGERMRWRA